LPQGFTAAFAKRLNGLSEIQVKEAEEGDPVVQGCAYIAPGGSHLEDRRLNLLDPDRCAVDHRLGMPNN
jgi:two-component system chemotaxis response regulator CheB